MNRNLSPNGREEEIDRLHRESLEKEQVFFERIAGRLGRPRLTAPPQRTVKGAPDFWNGYALDREENVALFMKNWESLGGIAKRFPDAAALGEFLEAFAAETNVKQVIRSDHPLLEEMRVDVRLKQAEVHVWQKETGESGGYSRLLEKAAGTDLGIAVVDFAIAHTGTVVIASGASQGRSISLLPTAFMGIVKASAIKTRMGEVLREIAAWNGNGLPAGIHFITGPSRSADIENDLTIGVHGPGIVCALVLDDE